MTAAPSPLTAASKEAGYEADIAAPEQDIHLRHLQQQLLPPLPPPIRTSLLMPAALGHDASSSRSNLSEADTFLPEPGSNTACSSPTTPPCSPPSSLPLSPPSAPRKALPRSVAPSYMLEQAESLLGPLPTKRCLLPEFDAVAQSAGLEAAPGDDVAPLPPFEILGPGRHLVSSGVVLDSFPSSAGQSRTPTRPSPKRPRTAAPLRDEDESEEDPSRQ